MSKKVITGEIYNTDHGFWVTFAVPRSIHNYVNLSGLPNIRNLRYAPARTIKESKYARAVKESK